MRELVMADAFLVDGKVSIRDAVYRLCHYTNVKEVRETGSGNWVIVFNHPIWAILDRWTWPFLPLESVRGGLATATASHMLRNGLPKGWSSEDAQGVKHVGPLPPSKYRVVWADRPRQTFITDAIKQREVPIEHYLPVV